ncbi:diguanylate cyclase [Arcobacter vandammei]|uniref:sensor domain-containing diguanylate cyclase n=1 Tax=Arcobacter vandammei TaxID=2782243 RepID=UPI0018DF54A9|nr:diguanylate cyclase [Arcobacter vandammei]
MKNIKKLFFILISIAFIETSIFIFLNNLNLQKENSVKEKYINRLNTHIKAILNSNESISSIIINEIISKKEIQNILNNINSEDENVQNQTREILLEIITPTFHRLVLEGFNQLHFHNKQGNSFLRFYGKDTFGDNVINLRNSIKEVHKTKKPQFGFEAGLMQNGFRNVFPILIDNNFIGTIELSNSFDNIHHTLHKNFPFEYKFIILKSYLNSNMDEAQIKKNYITSLINDNFYEEKFSDCNIKIIDKNILDKINTKMKFDIKNRLNNFEEFVTNIKLENNNYILSFLPLESFDKTTNIYIVSYLKDNEIAEIKNNLYINFFIVNLIIISLIILYLLRINFLEKNIFIKKAYTDALTNLLNRAKFNFDINEIINNRKLEKYSIIMYDIDFFKRVNDNYGHDIGDIVLKEFSNITKNSLRSDDLVYRWGGEEFIALIKSTSKDDLFKIAEKIRVNVENYNFTGIKNITSSFGITIASKNDSIDSLVKKADDALYRAKQTGRNKVVFYEDL